MQLSINSWSSSGRYHKPGCWNQVKQQRAGEELWHCRKTSWTLPSKGREITCCKQPYWADDAQFLPGSKLRPAFEISLVRFCCASGASVVCGWSCDFTRSDAASISINRFQNPCKASRLPDHVDWPEFSNKLTVDECIALECCSLCLWSLAPARIYHRKYEFTWLDSHMRNAGLSLQSKRYTAALGTHL